MSATTTLKMILLGEDKSASSALKGVGDEATKSTSKMDKFHKVGTAAGVALAGGLVLAGKAAVDMTKAAAADQAGAARLAQTLQKTTGATKEQVASVEDWISSQEMALGVSDDELRPALSKLAVATGSVAKAQKLASLAMDVSAGTGKSLESVSMALAKAQNGNISGLSRLGIATKNAKGETLSLTQVTQQLTDHYSGAAAAAADTTAGKQRILTVQYQELQEKIGAGLLPVMQKMVSVGMNVVNWISHNTTTAEVLVGVMGGLLAVTWGVSAAIKVWTAVTKLAAAAQWLLNVAMDANPIGLVVIAIAALVAGLIIAYKKSETFRNIVNAAFHGVQVVAAAVFNWIKSHWALLFAILGGPIGLATVLIIKNFDKVMDAIHAVGAVAKWLWNGAFQPALQFIVRGISFLLNVWAHMLLALGHVPGFGWATAAGNALQSAAQKANDLANNIRKIPTHKESTIVINTVHNVVHTTGGHVPAFASGTRSAPGGMAWVGEQGPELVQLPRGSRVYTAAQSRTAARAVASGGGTQVVVNVQVSPTADRRAIGQEIVTALRTWQRYNRNVAVGIKP